MSPPKQHPGEFNKQRKQKLFYSIWAQITKANTVVHGEEVESSKWNRSKSNKRKYYFIIQSFQRQLRIIWTFEGILQLDQDTC